jgi:hypothetical protein
MDILHRFEFRSQEITWIYGPRICFTKSLGKANCRSGVRFEIPGGNDLDVGKVIDDEKL